MVLTVFCLLMIAAFLGCLIATKSAYVLFGAFLLVFLMTGLLRRPIRYEKNRRIFVLYKFALRAIPVTQQITGNPNEIVFYQRDRGRRDSLVAVNAGEEQTVTGMSMYSYKRHRLFVLFPVPGFLRAVWQAELFFAAVTAASLVLLASVGFLPYLRLRRTNALLTHTVHTEVQHSDSPEVLRDGVLDNILLICRSPEGGADMLELLSFQHSSSELMPLYLHAGLYAELQKPADGTVYYQTVRDYCSEHGAAEIAACVEEQYYLQVNDTVCLDYAFLCAAADAAGGLPIAMTAEEIAAVNRKIDADKLTVPLLSGDGSVPVRCSWEQIRCYLFAEGAEDSTVFALRECAVTGALASVLADVTAGDLKLPEGSGAETSLTPERLYQLYEMFRSDRTHYEAAYQKCTQPDVIGRLCVPRTGNYRQLDGGTVYAAPGVIRQYMIRLIYY